LNFVRNILLLSLALPAIAYGSPISGRVMGPGFGFVLGNAAMFASAALTGGGGPWLPFQMLAAGGVGVVAGLVPGIVIAVPTSVGYGASFGGLAALLAMLNSCAPGVSVVNIDNGFGAGVFAARVARLAAGHGTDPS